jgi:lysophospholipase L1-like esterase
MWRELGGLVMAMGMASTAVAATAPATATGRGFLALGDSYTIGEAVPEAGRWPVQLAALLQARGLAIDAPRIIATTGWTTDELDAGIDAANAADPIPTDHALVSLLIGVNNQYRGRPLAEYEAQFAALLERAIGFAGGEPGRVIVLAIPDWGVTPFAIQSGRDRAQIAAQLDAFNAAAARIAQARGARFVDTAPASRERGGEPAMLADDGLHPSAAMYALWADAALPAASAALAR